MSSRCLSLILSKETSTLIRLWKNLKIWINMVDNFKNFPIIITQTFFRHIYLHNLFRRYSTSKSIFTGVWMCSKVPLVSLYVFVVVFLNFRVFVRKRRYSSPKMHIFNQWANHASENDFSIKEKAKRSIR